MEQGSNRSVHAGEHDACRGPSSLQWILAGLHGCFLHGSCGTIKSCCLLLRQPLCISQLSEPLLPLFASQGGIHPDFTGDSYLQILRTAKTAAPSIHVHAFSPLEVKHGAESLGVR